MKEVMIRLVRFYQRRISPLKAPCCRFYPTCSSYALKALEKHGALKGGLLAFWRILRCNPWNIGGIDYVPETWTEPFPVIGKKRPKEKS